MFVVLMTKTKEERLKEILEIYVKLKELGLSDDVCPKLKVFRKVANEFIKEGYSINGKIFLEEIGRTLIYNLTMQTNSTVFLKQSVAAV